MTDTIAELLADPIEIESGDEIPASNPASESNLVRDRDTGEMRPRRRPGRRRTGTPPPSDHEPITRETDTAPDSTSRGRKPRSTAVPRFKTGVIAAGMTKLYKRTGRILKAMDRGIGQAFIDCAEDCGEAWEDLARTNPRVRAVLMRLVTGGSVMALVMAHLPILMAILMKDGIRKHLPFLKFVESIFDSDDDSDASEVSDLFGGLNQEDVQQAMALIAQGPMAGMFGGMMNGMGAGPVAGMRARAHVVVTAEPDEE